MNAYADELHLTYRNMRPTRKHRPAVWENLLGTVLAMSPDGVVRYFDYDWRGAAQWAHLDEATDLRIARYRQWPLARYQWKYADWRDKPSAHQRILFVLDPEEK